MAVVVARVEVPVTARVPFEVRDEVAVMLPPVRVLIVAVMALNIVEKRFEEVAFTFKEFEITRLDMVPDVAYRSVVVRADDEALPSVV